MKRMVCAALGALCVFASAEQQASAWCKFNFGVGANVSWEGANNSLLWGGIKSGPAPGGMDGNYGFPGFGGPGFGGHAGTLMPGGSPMAQGGAVDPNFAGSLKPLPVPMLQPAPQMPKAPDAQPVGYWAPAPQYPYPYGYGYGYYPYPPMGYGYGYYGYGYGYGYGY
jgi:hypothetical protein